MSVEECCFYSSASATCWVQALLHLEATREELDDARDREWNSMSRTQLRPASNSLEGRSSDPPHDVRHDPVAALAGEGERLFVREIDLGGERLAQ